MSVITAKNLDVGYDGKAVVSGVDIEALQGQVICLLGRNGAGKTTILRTLAGLLAPVGGAVEMCGTDIRKIKQNELARKLSLVLTEDVSPSFTTVHELVSMGRIPYTGFMGRLDEEDERIIDEALETVGAAQLSDRYYDQLSDGEKQKVMIARALVQQPELIILDEPTSHLDIKHKIEVIRILQRLANDKGITCILSLHDIDLAIKGCQTLLLIDGDRIVAAGAPEDVVKSGCIGQLYDISGASYNELLGSVELAGNGENDVFVVGGGGSGINLYRALSRNGYGVTAGILHGNDVDFPIADAVCSRVISEAPYEKISEGSIEAALDCISESKCVVDAGFDVGSGNSGNIELIKRAVSLGKPVLSLRRNTELYGNCTDKINVYDSVSELICGVADIESLRKSRV